MGQCKNCSWWVKARFPGDWGGCDDLGFANSLLVGVADCGSDVKIQTQEDFGCTEFKKKEDEDNVNRA